MPNHAPLFATTMLVGAQLLVVTAGGAPVSGVGSVHAVTQPAQNDALAGLVQEAQVLHQSVLDREHALTGASIECRDVLPQLKSLRLQLQEHQAKEKTQPGPDRDAWLARRDQLQAATAVLLAKLERFIGSIQVLTAALGDEGARRQDLQLRMDQWKREHTAKTTKDQSSLKRWSELMAAITGETKPVDLLTGGVVASTLVSVATQENGQKGRAKVAFSAVQATRAKWTLGALPQPGVFAAATSNPAEIPVQPGAAGPIADD
jgi:hypothetical protein